MLSDRLPERAPWRSEAACRGLDDMPTGDVCVSCEVRRQCLSHALTEGIFEGRWGGYTGDERAVLLQLHQGDIFLTVNAATASRQLLLVPSARQLAAARARHPSVNTDTREQLELDL